MRGSPWNRLVIAVIVVAGVGVAWECTGLWSSVRHMDARQATAVRKRAERTIKRKGVPDVTPAECRELCGFFSNLDAKPNEDKVRRAEELMVRVGALSPGQILGMAAEMSKFGDRNYSLKRQQCDILQYAIESLAWSDPRAAVLLLKNPPEELKPWRFPSPVLPNVLSIWLKTDANAATGWIRSEIKSGDSVIDWDTISKLPGSMAASDPALAFSLARELSKKDLECDVVAITRNVADNRSRWSALEALREIKLNAPAEYEKLAGDAWLGFSQNLMNTGATNADLWLSAAKLDEEEKLLLAQNILKAEEPRDRAYWSGWMAESFVGGQCEDTLGRMIRSWATANYQDAGLFIHTLPDTPAKLVAVRSFAETVARVDADAAIDWVAKLPPGPLKEHTIRRIQAIRDTQSPGTGE